MPPSVPINHYLNALQNQQKEVIGTQCSDPNFDKLTVQKYLICLVISMNDLDFYAIPMLYHRDSSDFFAKP
jgi:hypothetical protein